MTATLQERPADQPTRPRPASRLLVPQFWAALSIVAMWLAVLFDGIFGSDITVTNSPTNVTILPSSVALALFALLGTAAVAKRAFGGRN